MCCAQIASISSCMVKCCTIFSCHVKCQSNPFELLWAQRGDAFTFTNKKTAVLIAVCPTLHAKMNFWEHLFST